MADYISCPVSLGSLKTNEDGTMEISFTVGQRHQYQLRKAVQTIRQEACPLAITVSKERKKRSLDANAYYWVLAEKLAKALKKTKLDIYKQHIQDVGVYDSMAMKNESVARFEQIWGERGKGWVVEVVDSDKLPGCKRIRAYYGSSTYNTEEMSRLIDLMVQDCKDQGIETLTTEELDAMKEAWNSAKRKP